MKKQVDYILLFGEDEYFYWYSHPEEVLIEVMGESIETKVIDSMKKGYICQGGITQTIQKDLSTKENLLVCVK